MQGRVTALMEGMRPRYALGLAVRAWRWRVEVQPVQNLFFYVCLYALATWLSADALGAVQRVLLILIAMCAAVIVAMAVSLKRQQRRARRRRADRG